MLRQPWSNYLLVDRLQLLPRAALRSEPHSWEDMDTFLRSAIDILDRRAQLQRLPTPLPLEIALRPHSKAPLPR